MQRAAYNKLLLTSTLKPSVADRHVQSIDVVEINKIYRLNFEDKIF